MENYLTPVILIIMALVAAYAVQNIRLAISLREKINIGDAVWHWALKAACEIAVNAAEQIAFENSDRLKFAEDYVYAYLAKAGFNFTEADRLIIRGAIEAALREMKEEIAE